MLFHDPFLFTKEGIQKFIDERSQEYLEKVKALPVTPHIAIYHDNSDPASEKYVKNKLKRFEFYGIEPYVTDNSILFNDQVFHLNRPSFIQQPHLCKKQLAVCNDCEGFSTIDIRNQLLGSKEFTLWPCTARGIFDHLEWALNHTREKKKPFVVIAGRSNLVGKPLANLLMAHDYTAAVIHSKTPYKKKVALVHRADVLISATGNRQWLTSVSRSISYKHFFNYPIYDVGINFENGKLCGDVDHSMIEGSMITPVPGGCGKLTVEALCWNIIDWYVNNRDKHYERYPR